MSVIDDSTAERLRREQVGWLVTVSPSGAPVPVPIWFLWEGGDSVLFYSQRDRPKLRNIAANPRVALHLDSTGTGDDDNVVLAGRAAVSDDPPLDRVGEYVAKYLHRIVEFGWTPESMAADYSVPVRIAITRVRAH